jgi:hypothetical protein
MVSKFYVFEGEFNDLMFIITYINNNIFIITNFIAFCFLLRNCSKTRIINKIQQPLNNNKF